MELSFEIYSWLNDLIDIPSNVNEPNSRSQKRMITLRPNLTSDLLYGKYMPQILSSLQQGYNTFYQLNLNYTDSLNQLKFNKPSNQVDNNSKYNNWKIIGDCLLNFGIIFDESQFLSLSQGNIGILKEVLTKVYSLSNELMRKSIQPNASTFIVSPLIENKTESNKEEQPQHDEPLSNTTNNNNTINEPSSFDIPQQSAFNDISAISRQSNISNANNAIDISLLDKSKPYFKCESPLEFFIVSLCRNFNIQTRQAVALLSNNRKYLTLLFYKGIKGSFDLNLNWLNDIASNIKVFTDLLLQWENNKGIGYATIGVGLYSKSALVSSTTLKTLELIRMELGTDHDWIKNEGIDLFIYAINKHDTIRKELIEGMYSFIKDIIDEFIELINTKYSIKEERNSIVNFITTMMPYFKTMPTALESKLFNWVINISLSSSPLSNADVGAINKSFSLSLLTELWINKESYSSIDIESKAKIMSEFKSAIRDNSTNSNLLCLTSISLLFHLMNNFAEHKTESGPMIYKTIVFLFLENYDSEIIREHILINFSHFYFNNQNVPLTIFIEPYFNQLLSMQMQQYQLCDFNFLCRIMSHPRLQSNHLKSLIEFTLSVSLNSIYYSKCASLLLVELFNRKLLHRDQYTFNEGVKIFTTHIKSVLSLYMDNIKNDINDNAILEILYDILIEKVLEINESVKEAVINAVQYHRKLKGSYKNCLLALLWFYIEHDEVLLRLEEECAIHTHMHKQAKSQTNINANNNSNSNKEDNSQLSKKTNQRAIVVIDSTKKIQQTKHPVEEALLQIKKQKEEKVIMKREEMIKKKIKEQKLQRSLEKQLAKKSLALGIQSVNQSKLSPNDTSNNQLIQDEGSIINNTTIKLQQRKPISKMKLNTLIDFNSFNYLIKLSEEEPREQRAIEAYLLQYKKKLKTIFKHYIANESLTITKASILKMLRDKAFINTDITLDELSFGIRNCFGYNLNEIAFEQFSSLLIILSYLIYTKKNKGYTISECYYHLLNALLISSSSSTGALGTNNGIVSNQRDKHKPVINYLKFCLNEGIDFLYPPGYKQTEEISVVYKSSIPKTFTKHLIEPYRISLIIVNDIILNAIGSPILEPFLKVKRQVDIDIDLGEIHKWSFALTIAYSKLPSIYSSIGIEVADCIEDMMIQLCKGRDKMGNIILHPNSIKEQEKKRATTETEAKRDEIRQKRLKEIKEQADQYKKEKEERKRQQVIDKERTENERKKQFHDQLVLTKKKNKQIQEEINEIKKKKEEEEQAKNLLAKQIKHDENLKLQEEKQKFFKNYNRRLKEQFKLIKTQKETINKKKLELMPINQKLPEVESNYIKEDDKSYFEFEKKQTALIEELRNRADIKAVFDKYEDHLRTVFDIYVKIGRNKLSLNLPEEAIQINEYKEFLVNFTVFGLLISSEQMNFAFKKLTRKTEDSNGNGSQLALSFNDFKTSIMYLIIMSRFNDSKSIKITHNELNKTDEVIVNNFFFFLGFSLPFEKREIENMINTRRGMSAKAFFEFQLSVKRDKVEMIKGRRMMRTVKSKSRLVSANANRRRVIDINANSNSRGNDIKTNNELIKSNSETVIKCNIVNGADKGNSTNIMANTEQSNITKTEVNSNNNTHIRSNTNAMTNINTNPNTEIKDHKVKGKTLCKKVKSQSKDKPIQSKEMKIYNAQGTEEELWAIKD